MRAGLVPRGYEQCESLSFVCYHESTQKGNGDIREGNGYRGDPWKDKRET